MPPWLGTLIVLALVGAMVTILALSLVRDKKRGKGCCGGCAQCKLQCPSRQKTRGNAEKDGK